MFMSPELLNYALDQLATGGVWFSLGFAVGVVTYPLGAGWWFSGKE